MRKHSGFIIRTLIFFILFSIGYYFLYLIPQSEEPEKLQVAKQVLTEHHSNLIQNRVSFVELTRLDPDSANFDLERSDLSSRLKQTIENGLELTRKENTIPDVDDELSNKFPELIEEQNNIYNRQQELLEKVFTTDSYDAGLKILESEEAINILTDQTNLILKYEFYLKKIDQKQQ